MPFCLFFVFQDLSPSFLWMLRLQTNLPHVRQKYDWDCGLACVRMVLKRIFPDSFTEAKFDDVCQQRDFGTSVWTIDLAHILTYYKVDYMFYTETLGVDLGYQQNPFYRDTFDMDEVRVNRLFSCAADLEIKVEKRTITLDEICVHLNKGCVAIVLINNLSLTCDWCGRSLNQLRYLMQRYCVGCSAYGRYMGHYVIICGYDLEKKYFYYKNPSYDIELCCVSFGSFEDAWHCYGTDSDILFVNTGNATDSEEYDDQNE